MTMNANDLIKAAPGNTLIDRLLQLRSTARAWKVHRRDRRLLAAADAAIVSFPKSGRTWVRVMLSRLCQTAFDLPEDTVLWMSKNFEDLRKTNPQVPLILFTHDVNAMIPTAKMSSSKEHYTGRPVALLARHPADIVVSRYFHLKHRSTDPARKRLAAAPMQQFVWTNFGGLPAIVTFLNHWAAAARTHPEFLIVRYEDFHASPGPTLLALAHHIGIPATAETAQEAADFAAFDRLKKKEAEGFFATDRLRPRKAGEKESFKVRSGKVGKWRDNFTPEEADLIDRYIAENLDPVFGYSTTG